MNDLVSIILPVYNGERYLEESIESIINQTYSAWELIILDDCSDDRTSEIAKGYVEKDSRIKYIRNESNLKLPRNLNKGFSLSKGDYLTWTSDDNIFLPNALDKMVQALKEENTDFVFASCRIIDDYGKEVEYIMVDDSSRKRIVGENSVGACFMYTRKIYNEVGDYNPDLVLVEDFDYWQRICGKYRFSIISSIQYKYRWHQNALTTTMKQDVFYKNLRKTLLKNIENFGDIDFEGKFYYYRGLEKCRKGLQESITLSFILYKWYMLQIIFRQRLPKKIKSIFKLRGNKNV